MPSSGYLKLFYSHVKHEFPGSAKIVLRIKPVMIEISYFRRVSEYKVETFLNSCCKKVQVFIGDCNLMISLYSMRLSIFI